AAAGEARRPALARRIRRRGVASALNPWMWSGGGGFVALTNLRGTRNSNWPSQSGMRTSRRESGSRRGSEGAGPAVPGPAESRSPAARPSESLTIAPPFSSEAIVAEGPRTGIGRSADLAIRSSPRGGSARGRMPRPARSQTMVSNEGGHHEQDPYRNRRLGFGP